MEPKENGSEKIIRKNLPVGFIWLAFYIPGKIAYRLISGLAISLDRAWTEFYRIIVFELNPYKTTDLMSEWEKALGLPDRCIGPMTDLEERRKMVILKLLRKRYTTAPTWVDLARDIFGLEITITPGWYVQKPCLFPMEFPLRFDRYPKLGRFRIYIDVHNIEFGGFPYDGTSIPSHQFPIPFGKTDEGFKRFKCFVERIRPVNVVIIWNNNPLNTTQDHSSEAYVPLEIPAEI